MRKQNLLLTFALFVCMVFTSCTKSLIEKAVEEVNKQCPMEMGPMTWEKAEYQDDQVTFLFLVDESFVNVSELAKQPEVMKAGMLTNFSNPDEKMNNFLQLLIKADSDLHIVFKGKTSGDEAEVVLSAEELKGCMEDESTTPEDKLKGLLKTTNLQFPLDMQNGMVITQCVLEGNMVYYVYEIDEDFYNLEMMQKQADSGVSKQNITLAMKTSDDVSKNFYNAIMNANKGLGFRYVGTTSGQVSEVTFTNEELKEIL